MTPMKNFNYKKEILRKFKGIVLRSLLQFNYLRAPRACYQLSRGDSSAFADAYSPFRFKCSAERGLVLTFCGNWVNSLEMESACFLCNE
ncbi:hypothetical protein CYMTET_17187 [Cymbomonas tetramitiformis]|uniref:Uncharacterized protein n=1 Tax=Cymbomonas tetramitiformis TaxID=36881 RepID=A0AAE0L7H7_9CHLO|nr:hypothetical protein CYMTET_17187 [Cymbomonas tetramitiformis]